MADLSTVEQTKPRFFSVREVAEILKVAPLTVYRAVEDGRITCVKIGSGRGGRVLIPVGFVTKLENQGGVI